MFDNHLEKEEIQEAKILWFSCISMLRAIGHVMDKVDRKNQPESFSIALDIAYEEWRKLPIFKNFINEERNSILKEYSFTIEPTSIDKTFYLVDSDGHYLVDGSQHLVSYETVSDLIKTNGYDTSQHPSLILEEALIWWNEELTKLEKN